MKRWYDTMKRRPGVIRGFQVLQEVRQALVQAMDDQARQVLFGQGR